MNLEKTSYGDISVLCIDDEKNILSALKRELLGSGFKVFTALSGAEGLSILSAEKVDVVISDMKMPVMSGIEFFENVTKQFPSVFRILLTGFTEMQSLIDAINKGNIHRYFEKPWSDEDLAETLIAQISKIRLARQNTRLQTLLEKQNSTLFSVKSTLEKKVEIRTQQVRNALSKHHQNEVAMQKLLYNMIKINPHMDRTLANAVSVMAGRLADYCHLTTTDVKDIKLAAKFFDMGLLGLDVQSLSAPFEKLKFSAQQKYLSQIHQVSLILSSADGLRNIETILVNQFEYTNGSGYPNKLALADIPIGSRILAIARDYWRYRMGKIVEGKLSHKIALREIKKYGGTRYDLALVDIVIENPEISSNTQKITVLNTPDLESGMRLSKSVYGEKHNLLLSEGHVLTVQNIQSFARYEKVQNTKLKISVEP